MTVNLTRTVSSSDVVSKISVALQAELELVAAGLVSKGKMPFYRHLGATRLVRTELNAFCPSTCLLFCVNPSHNSFYGLFLCIRCFSSGPLLYIQMWLDLQGSGQLENTTCVWRLRETVCFLGLVLNKQFGAGLARGMRSKSRQVNCAKKQEII